MSEEKEPVADENIGITKKTTLEILTKIDPSALKDLLQTDMLKSLNKIDLSAFQNPVESLVSTAFCPTPRLSHSLPKTNRTVEASTPASILTNLLSELNLTNQLLGTLNDSIQKLIKNQTE